jgi:myosin heavy subunit
MSVKKIIIAILALVVLGVLIAATVVSAVKTEDLKNIQQTQLKSRDAKIQELNILKEDITEKLDKALQEKNMNQSEVDRLQKEKEAADQEAARLKAELQAKVEAKAKLAKASAPAKTASTASQSGGSIQDIIIAAANKYGASSDRLLRVAKCESTFNPLARNPKPIIDKYGVNHGYPEGLFQYIPATWTRLSAQAGYAGAVVTDAVANANVTAWSFVNGRSSEWECK